MGEVSRRLHALVHSTSDNRGCCISMHLGYHVLVVVGRCGGLNATCTALHGLCSAVPGGLIET